MGLCSKPKPPPPSEAERYQADRAVRRLEEWENDGYKDLENEGIQRSKADYSNYLRGKANADLNAAQGSNEQMLGMTAGQGDMALQTGSVNRGFRRSLSGALTDAHVNAQKIKDSRRLGMAKVGQDVALQTDSALASAARRGFSKSMADLQAQTIRNQARTQALVNVASGATYGLMERKGGKSDTQLANQEGSPSGNYYQDRSGHV